MDHGYPLNKEFLAAKITKASVRQSLGLGCQDYNQTSLFPDPPPKDQPTEQQKNWKGGNQQHRGPTKSSCSEVQKGMVTKLLTSQERQNHLQSSFLLRRPKTQPRGSMTSCLNHRPPVDNKTEANLCLLHQVRPSTHFHNPLFPVAVLRATPCNFGGEGEDSGGSKARLKSPR